MLRTILLAGLGGFIIKLLDLLELQNISKDRRPDFKDWLYWLPFFVWPLIAGVLGFVYSTTEEQIRLSP